MTGLEALKIVEKDCEDLEQAPYGELAIIEKYLKAFVIVNNKGVKLYALKQVPNYVTYKCVSSGCHQGIYLSLTEEEFNLLKEVEEYENE